MRIRQMGFSSRLKAHKKILTLETLKFIIEFRKDSNAKLAALRSGIPETYASRQGAWLKKHPIVQASFEAELDDREMLKLQKALAEILNIDKSYMATILDYLEEKGFVIREKNPNDRREQLIKLTALAKINIPVIKEAIKKLNERAFNDICQSNKQLFNEILSKIQENLVDTSPEFRSNTHSLSKNYN